MRDRDREKKREREREREKERWGLTLIFDIKNNILSLSIINRSRNGKISYRHTVHYAAV